MSRFSSFGSSNNPMFNKVSNTNSSGGQVIDSHMLWHGVDSRQLMTANGAVNKTFILLGILLVTAFINWNLQSFALTIGGAVVGLVCVIALMFKQNWAPYLAPVYAAGEGLFLAGISAIFAARAGDEGGFIGGIVFQAITITMSLLFIMLMTYKAGWIKVTDKFRSGVMMATMGLAAVYLIVMVARWFGAPIPFMHEMGTMGIVICCGVIVLACLNLLLDFDFFEKGEQAGLPRYMEWFAAFGLLVTLVWLYVEVLRLLSILSDND